ncbi:MAG: acetolactate synthase [Methanobacteriaceae archaeon]|nr:acetolactate synthase [Methanobacteriaceae archaeon]
MTIKQISVFLENKEGRLSKILNILKREDIDIRALSLADTSEFGLLRMIVHDYDKAKKALEKENLAITITEVLAVEVPDTPGGLESMLNILTNEKINVEYIYAFVEKKTQKAIVVIRTEENDKSIKLLKDNGFTELSQQDVYQL